MSNKEKIAWCVGAAMLVFLFLLSSTDLIIKERKQEIYPISVIVEDTNDEYYGNFKKGMDKAAEKYHADVSFITLYEEKDNEEQMELVRREIRDGAKAVILSPVDEAGAVMALDEMQPNCPIIFLGSMTLNNSVAVSLTLNQYEAGSRLAEEVTANETLDTPVCLFTEGLSYSGNTEIFDGIRSVLEEKGFSYRLVEKKDSDSYRKAIEETVYPGTEEIVIIAMDPAALREAAGIMEGSSVYQKQVAGLYGIGCSSPILNALDKGIIKGLIVYNQFDEGYLSVQYAVEAVRGIWGNGQELMDCFYIEAKDLRDKTYERMLYPKE